MPRTIWALLRNVLGSNDVGALFSFTQAQKKAPAEQIRNCQLALAETSRNLEAAKENLQRAREAFIEAVESRGLFDFSSEEE